jgi:FtsH-binding integral membrane protein
MPHPELISTSGPRVPETMGRGNFIKSTYLHLCAAILGFAVVSAALKASGISAMTLTALSGSRFAWLGVMGAFLLVGWLASSLADNAQRRRTQLTGLSLAVVGESLIFAPLLAMADAIAPGAISSAAIATVALIGGLSYVAFTSKGDFSFLGGILKVGVFVALGLIVASILIGFKLGVWFSGAMVIFASAAVLYDTTQIIRHYPADRPAGAALHLFSSFALLFWYMVRLLIDLASDD